jgi:hypothetical protein
MRKIDTALLEFINGNINVSRKELSGYSHKKLRDAYDRITCASAERAIAFADYIKGSISFQEFCDTP